MTSTHIIKKSTLTLLSLFTLFALQGCIATTVVGTAAVATKVATDPRSAGRQLDDEVLEEKIAYNLMKDSQLKEETRINVVVYNGKALLIGQALSEEAADSAKSIAEGVDGVEEVFNEIRLAQKISPIQIATDSWITSTIKSKLLLNAEVKATEVKVVTENGEVFLMGALTNTQTEAAVDVARNVRGVRKVVRVIHYAD